MNRKINASLRDLTGKVFHFEGLRELAEFLKNEEEFWWKSWELVKGQGTVHPAFGFRVALKSALQAIEDWSEELLEWDDSLLQQRINELCQRILNNMHVNWLWSGHAVTAAFVDCHREQGNAVATAFLNYVTKKQLGNLAQHSNFLGAVIGYEFMNQDSDLLKRRRAEKVSLGQLRSQFSESKDQLIAEVEEFKHDFSSWNARVRGGWAEWLHQASEEHSKREATRVSEFETYVEECKKKISELENTYQEKLRLEKPARYWRDAARKFGIQGGLWSLALVGSVLLGVVYLSEFFTEWLRGQATLVKLHSLQGIVIFGTILTVYAFFVRTLSRLTFSSFHLMRDAEEREQLTYLYLSLVNERTIDEGARDIVLQALFSRSETGLLTAESGPTMPGMGEVLRAASTLKTRGS